MKAKEIILYIVTVLLSLTLFLMVIRIFQTRIFLSFLWYCYIAIFIIIIGLLKRDSRIIMSQVIILAIPDLLWIFDFFYLIFTGHSLLGLTKDFPGAILFEKITSVQHLYVVPLSLLALSMLKVKKNYKILLIGFGELALLFLLTRIVSPILNINCVINSSCISLDLTFLPYPLIWFLFAFSFIIISYFVLISLPFIKKNKS